MTFADIVILVTVLVIMAWIIGYMIKKKDEGSCANCAYARVQKGKIKQ